MSKRRATLGIIAGMVAATLSSCGPESEVRFGRTESALTQAIEYVGKTTTTDFRGPGMGQHLMYFPAFGLTTPRIGLRTDCANCIEVTPEFADFEHHIIFPLDKRTFSPDAGGSPIGVKTAGGYANWDSFTLPDGTTGRSGTTYDTSVCNNSNNFVNQIRINSRSLTEFCLNLITDNTDGDFDPDIRLEARSDDVDLDLEGHPDFTFDGRTDMHTFRYTGMEDNDRIKIRIKDVANCPGAGLGGIMVSHIDTCTGSCTPNCSGKTCGDDGCGGSCGTCPNGAVCQAGTCSPPPPDVRVVSSATGLSHAAAAGAKRLLVFTGHGVDKRDRQLQSVSYGGRPMRRVLARSRKGDGRYASTSIWILEEADIAAASGNAFSVNWSRRPSDRNYTSVFLTGVDQGSPIESTTSGSCASCREVACGAMTVEAGHVELYAATSRNNGDYTPQNGFTELQDVTMGSRGQATSGYKEGASASEVARLWHPRDKAQAIGCVEIRN